LHEVEVLRLDLRIGVTLERINVVLRDELALLSLNAGSSVKKMPGRILIVQVSPSAETCGMPSAVFGRTFTGPRQEIVRIRRVENLPEDDARVQVVDLRRVEAGFGDEERVAQGFLRRLARGFVRRRKRRSGTRPAARWTVSEASRHDTLRAANRWPPTSFAGSGR
jgi:hypothetical protein